MFFNFIKNTCGGFLKHWIYKFSAKPPIADTVNSKLLFIVDILLYVVSNTVILAVSSALILNNENPLTLSAFVCAVNVILTLLAGMLTEVSLVKGGVIIAKLSIENNTVSGGFPVPPVISSDPQPVITANVKRNIKSNVFLMALRFIYNKNSQIVSFNPIAKESRIQNNRNCILNIILI
jgi:hypothetical protein